MSKKIYSPLIQDPLTKKYYRQELKLHEGIVLTGQQQFISDLIEQRDDYKTQRDTLIDDIAVLRGNNERLERENENAMELLKDFSKFINYKLIVSPASDTYKHYRSELDKLGVK